MPAELALPSDSMAHPPAHSADAESPLPSVGERIEVAVEAEDGTGTMSWQVAEVRQPAAFPNGATPLMTIFSDSWRMTN